MNSHIIRYFQLKMNEAWRDYRDLAEHYWLTKLRKEAGWTKQPSKTT